MIQTLCKRHVCVSVPVSPSILSPIFCPDLIEPYPWALLEELLRRTGVACILDGANFYYYLPGTGQIFVRACSLMHTVYCQIFVLDEKSTEYYGVQQ